MRRITFDERGYVKGRIPKACVNDCTITGGPADENVEYWRLKLDFKVPRDLAIDHLAKSGGWPRLDLKQADDDTLARRVLWMACWDIKESGVWHGLVE